jgi:serine/threonine protein kinase
MVDFFDGEIVNFNNITPDVANKALQGLAQIHQLSICHGDIYEAQCTLLRNMMVSKTGEVKWIDFEHSWTDEGEEIENERLIALQLWGPGGKKM